MNADVELVEEAVYIGRLNGKMQSVYLPRQSQVSNRQEQVLIYTQRSGSGIWWGAEWMRRKDFWMRVGDVL